MRLLWLTSGLTLVTAAIALWRTALIPRRKHPAILPKMETARNWGHAPSVMAAVANWGLGHHSAISSATKLENGSSDLFVIGHHDSEDG
jgi:hypothetical protein